MANNKETEGTSRSDEQKKHKKMMVTMMVEIVTMAIKREASWFP